MSDAAEAKNPTASAALELHVEQGWSVAETARRLGCSQHQVRLELASRSTSRPSRVRCADGRLRPGRRASELELLERGSTARRRRQDGATMRAIAGELGVSVGTVARTLSTAVELDELEQLEALDGQAHARRILSNAWPGRPHPRQARALAKLWRMLDQLPPAVADPIRLDTLELAIGQVLDEQTPPELPAVRAVELALELLEERLQTVRETVGSQKSGTADRACPGNVSSEGSQTGRRPGRARPSRPGNLEV